MDIKHIDDKRCTEEYEIFKEAHTSLEKGIVNDFCQYYKEFFHQQLGMISNANHFLDELDIPSAPARASLRRSPAIVLGIGMPAAAGAGYGFTRLVKSIQRNLKKIKFWNNYNIIQPSDIRLEFQHLLKANGLEHSNLFFDKHNETIKNQLEEAGKATYIKEYNDFVTRLKKLKE